MKKNDEESFERTMRKQVWLSRERIERAAFLAGKRTISGKRINSFDIHLLYIGDESITEHSDAHAVAHLHYSMQFEIAETEYRKAQSKYQLWFDEKFAGLSDELRQETSGRILKVEIEAAVRRKYPKKYKKLYGKMARWRTIRNALEQWKQAWERKGYRFGQLRIDAEDRGSVDRAIAEAKGMEEFQGRIRGKKRRKK